MPSNEKSSSSGSLGANKQAVIIDLDQRRRAVLAELDNARFSWFHAKICLVAGAGFFTDAYDIFAVSLQTTMLGYVYGALHAGLNTNQALGVQVSTPVGTLVGQLFFGWLADRVGRKRMYGVELIIMIVGSLGQAIAGSAASVNILGVIIFWRFIIGVGVGGDYPLSAIISSEFAATRIRGRMMAATFSAQGWGNLASAIVGLIITAAYKNSILNDSVAAGLKSIDPMWRILVGLGCVPGCIALYFRLTISETPRFTMDIERNVRRAAEDIRVALEGVEPSSDDDIIVQRAEVPKATWADFRAHFDKWENMKVLIGTSWSWFALDIAFYGLGLNSGTILTAIGYGTPLTSGTQKVYDNLTNIATGNTILAVAGLIPGYYATFFLVDVVGRKPIQLMGFSVLTVLFIIMGFGYNALTSSSSASKAFFFLYCLTNFFQNFGPNTTTFIIPGEAFPTRYRSTAHGISAASGKLGAIIAQVGFVRLKDRGGGVGSNKFVKHILEIFALFMLTGIFSTLLIPETKGRTLEEISNEDQDGFVRGTGEELK